MAFAPPEQQSAARQMKQVKLHKSAKPGKIDKHSASLARRSALTHRTAVQKINQLLAQIRWSTFASVTARAERAQNALGDRVPPHAPQEIVLHLKKLAALLKQLVDSIFSPLAQALGGGGGSSSSGKTCSGSDPPCAGLINVKIVTLLMIFMIPSIGKMALINSFSQQDNSGVEINFDFTNNDPSAIYNSGQLNLDAMLGNVADSIIANNSAYSGFTRNDVMSEWGASIRAPPTGEVYTGWSRSLDGNGVLQLTHNQSPGIPDVTYTTWRDSTFNEGSKDLIAITLSVPKSQLDFNGNGLFDVDTESIYKTTETVGNAFTGTSESGLTNWSADGNSYNVVPEPATQGLITLGCIAALAYRRYFSK